MAPSAQSMPRGLAADAAAGAGDDAGAPVEPEVHQSASTRSEIVDRRVSPAERPVHRALARRSTSSRSRCSSLELGRQAQGDRRSERGAWPVVVDVDVDLDRRRASQPLRSAYISIVIAVQAARLAASSRVGEGPVSVPPASARLVDDERVAALDLDVVGVALAPAGDDLHASAPCRRPSNSAGSSTSAKRAIA